MIYIDEELEFKSDPNNKYLLYYKDSVITYYSSYIFKKEIQRCAQPNTKFWYYIIGTLYISCEEELIIIPYITNASDSTKRIGIDWKNFQKWVNKIGDYQPSIYDLEMFNR